MKIRQFFREQTFAILLSCSLEITISYIYVRGIEFLMFAGISMLLTLFYFAVYYSVFRRKTNVVAASGIVVGLLIISVFLAFRITADSQNKMTAYAWFFSPEIESLKYTDYTFALIVMLGFLISSAVFYFTAVRYRSFMVFMICIIPFALFAKTFTDIVLAFPVIIMTLYFLVMIQQHQKNRLADCEHMAGNMRETVAIVLFMATVSLLAAFLPKVEETPYREEFDELITGIEIYGGTNYADISDSSSGGGRPPNDNQLLYTIHDPDNDIVLPLYLRTQVFDIPVLESNSEINYISETWIRDTEVYDNMWEKPGQSYDYDTFVKAFLKLLGSINGYDGMNFTAPQSVQPLVSPHSISVVREFSDSTYLVATPLNVTDIVWDSSDYISCTANKMVSEQYISSIVRTDNDNYTVSYLQKKFNADFCELYTQAKKTIEDLYYSGDEKFIELYNNGLSLLSEEESDSLTAVSDEILDAYDYGYNTLRDSTYDTTKIKALAEDVTTDCESDYEKAKAIESYFTEAGFVYDAEYQPSNGSTEYFLFTSHKGSCSDFTSAMVLMARSVGLNVRYVEGFLASEKDESGDIKVRVRDAHAFPEVYVSGYGWMGFEPTVAGTDSVGYYESDFVKIMLIIVIGTVLTAGLAILIIFVRPKIGEALFTRKLKKCRGSQQAMLLYPQINRMLTHFSGAAENTLCSAELAHIASDKLGTDINGLCDNYNNSFYGGRNNPDGDFSETYTALKTALKAVKKQDKHKSAPHKNSV